MGSTAPPPELTEAHHLIKTGQRAQAGQVLKAYLTAHPRDPNAWWLMAHAVRKNDHVRQCLETVLKLNPNHNGARQKLAALSTAPDGEPDDTFFTRRKASTPPPAPASPAPDPAPDGTNGTFEAYLAQAGDRADPFAAPPADDPFESIPASSAASVWQPFDPAAQAKAAAPDTAPAQAPGTGNQPEWGPGLAYVTDGAAPPAGGPPQPPRPRGMVPPVLAVEDDEPAPSPKANIEKVIGVAVVGVALVVLVGLLLYAAGQRGLIGTGGDGVPALATLDGGSFTIQYPTGWDHRCRTEPLGYPVCGIANSSFYNEVDWYASKNVNLGELMSQALSSIFTGGKLPDEQVSIIVMDVPQASPSYDNGSMAKTKYEWSQQGWGLSSDKATVVYDRRERTLDGYTAYYYKYASEDPQAERNGWPGRDVAYDVYIPHDGIMLWMTVTISSDIRDRDYDKTIQAMIESIRIKPVDEWTPAQG